MYDKLIAAMGPRAPMILAELTALKGVIKVNVGTLDGMTPQNAFKMGFDTALGELVAEMTPDESVERTETLGEYRVGVTFNPSASNTVSAIKSMASELIDLVGEIPDEGNREVARLKALAQTHAEDAAMWGVKAATKPPRV